MRGCRPFLLALAVLTTAIAPTASAGKPFHAQLRSLLAGAAAAASRDTLPSRPLPQAIPAATDPAATLDLRDVSRPFALEAKLRPFARQAPGDLKLTVVDGQARLGDFGIGSDQAVTGHLLVLQGQADISGTLRGNVVTYDGDIVLHRGARVEGDVVALRGEVRNDGATVTGAVRTVSARALARAIAREGVPLTPFERTLRNLAGVSGVFLVLLLLGWACVFFARSNLEIVSDTVRFSFSRALAVGLLGQVLATPTFGMLVVGLILSVAGILLLPFAVLAFALLLVVTVLGGGLAASHAMGETLVRRRLALGAVGTPTGYRAVAAGLALPASLWYCWALFSWVPIADTIILGAALLATWFVGTAGFGAALLSRAGVRENFAGRLIPREAMTDEFLWATPQFGVPAVKRPTDTPRPGSTTRTGGGKTGE